MTTDLPLALLVRTIPIYSRAVFKEQFPDEARTTKWKGYAWARPEGVYWCARAYDKGARGGRVWHVDVDGWKGRGRAGEGWSVPLVDERVGDESDAEEEENGASEGSSDEDGNGGDSGDEDENEEGGEENEEEEEDEEAYGRKKRKAPAKRVGRPRKAAKTSKAKAKKTTKDKVKARKKAHPTASASRLPYAVEIDTLPPDPYERALRLLHVGATPESLPCREEEFVDVLSRVEEGVESGGGGCLCELPLLLFSLISFPVRLGG